MSWLEKLNGLDPRTPEFTEALYSAFVERMRSEGLFEHKCPVKKTTKK